MAATDEELLAVASELDTIASWQSASRAHKVSALAARVRSYAGVEPASEPAPPPVTVPAGSPVDLLDPREAGPPAF